MRRGFSSLDAGVLAKLGGLGLPASGTGKDWILEGPACGWWGGLDALPEGQYQETTPIDVFSVDKFCSKNTLDLEVTSDSIQGPPADVSAPTSVGRWG